MLDAGQEACANADLPALAKTLGHLSSDEQGLLFNQMAPCKPLLSGGLAAASAQPIGFELKEGPKPCHIRQPFSIPECCKPATKKEIGRLCQLGALEKRSDSEWACGTFIIPKKAGGARAAAGFRKLSEMIARRPFPIPKIKG